MSAYLPSIEREAALGHLRFDFVIESGRLISCIRITSFPSKYRDGRHKLNVRMIITQMRSIMDTLGLPERDDHHMISSFTSVDILSLSYGFQFSKTTIIYALCTTKPIALPICELLLF
jgi:hypothetical protein